MSELLAIIDRYKDTHGQPSDASIARAIGVAPQTISSWRKRGIRELPAPETLRRLADFVRAPRVDVLDAAAIDAGYLDPKDVRPRRAEGPEDQGRQVRGA